MKNQKQFAGGWVICMVLSLIIFPWPDLTYPQTSESEDQMIKAFKDMETTADYEKFINTYHPDELAFLAVQKLTKPFLERQDWPGAVAVYQKYKPQFPGMEQKFDKIIALLNAPAVDVEIKNLGSGVNTDAGEYCPVISADNKRLYFLRTRDKFITVGNLKFRMEDEDVFYSKFDSMSAPYNWGSGIKMVSICTDNPEGPLGISSDGNTLLVFGNYEGSIGRGDIFFTEKKAYGWGKVKPMPAPINSGEFDADATFTADGKAILFVSDRPGGVGTFQQKDEFFHGDYWGNTDIYVCLKQSDTTWTGPINLGPIINTPYCERSPFLHPDGKTLYFSSTGHPGFGELDVFKATRLSDTSWTQWSAPENLGKEYNSSDYDWGYMISTAGDLAYLSVRNRSNSYGGSDIYSVKLKETAKPLAVTTVSGKITDPDGKALEAKIKWDDQTMGKPAGEAKSDPQNGRYFIVLPAGHRYGYHAELEGYIGKSEHLDLTDKKQFTEYNLDIVLYPAEKIKEVITKGDSVISIEVNNIFFDIDRWELKKESHEELDRWVEFLAANPDIPFEIHGHTDNTGTDDHNLVLSEKRAAAVQQYLLNKGITRSRMTIKGFGRTKPVETNDTEEGRQKNRRVQIVFGKVATK
ncbi:MAG: OmpA family protein [candidate division KSB1 bacterium]|nr:OmpA family protein [candidate division KSB1 bacterium]MDZ7317583.1 OmpA family protein [candidate division KSB1 bacterium]MDZ7340190.1 OmpA family protein [candidate division KSB1 bacterium]